MRQNWHTHTVHRATRAAPPATGSSSAGSPFGRGVAGGGNGAEGAPEAGRKPKPKLRRREFLSANDEGVRVALKRAEILVRSGKGREYREKRAREKAHGNFSASPRGRNGAENRRGESQRRSESACPADGRRGRGGAPGRHSGDHEDLRAPKLDLTLAHLQGYVARNAEVIAETLARQSGNTFAAEARSPRSEAAEERGQRPAARDTNSRRGSPTQHLHNTHRTGSPPQSASHGGAPRQQNPVGESCSATTTNALLGGLTALYPRIFAPPAGGGASAGSSPHGHGHDQRHEKPV